MFSSKYKILPIILLSLFTISCTKGYVTKVLKDNPEIIAEIIRENPKLIIDSLNKASQEMRKKQVAAAEKLRRKQKEQEFDNPKKPVISSSRAVFGKEDAPITIVKYSDFQCFYCKRSSSTVKQILEDYKGKVRMVYKHLPLDFHKQAYLAAQYYEGVVMEDKSKARAFYDKVFEKQSELSKGEKLMDDIVKKIGLSPSKVKKHFNEVKEIIDDDIREAQKFGFSGTPAFLVGGVSLSGAQPIGVFKEIIERHIEKRNL